jgi:hypothetical protein
VGRSSRTRGTRGSYAAFRKKVAASPAAERRLSFSCRQEAGRPVAETFPEKEENEVKNAGSQPRTRNLLAGPLAAIVFTAGLASPAPLRADCLVGYANCVDAASDLETFWKRSAEGIACFVDLVDCLQRRLR